MIPVLFVDDNRELCTLYRSLLSEAGPFSVHTCTSGAEALAWLEDHAPVVVISDYDIGAVGSNPITRSIKSMT